MSMAMAAKEAHDYVFKALQRIFEPWHPVEVNLVSDWHTFSNKPMLTRIEVGTLMFEVVTRDLLDEALIRANKYNLRAGQWDPLGPDLAGGINTTFLDNALYTLLADTLVLEFKTLVLEALNHQATPCHLGVESKTGPGTKYIQAIVTADDKDALTIDTDHDGIHLRWGHHTTFKDEYLIPVNKISITQLALWVNEVVFRMREDDPP